MRRLLFRVFKALCIGAACYVLLALLSAAVFHLPWSILELAPEAKRDQLISSGVVSASSHPLYREWLMGFVRPPNAPFDPVHILDSYLAYGQTVRVTTDNDDNDALGFANTVSPAKASVLFVGDSFFNGASVGTRHSPPAVFARLTGTQVYNASNGGYGLNQYVRILEKLTSSLPEGERFPGSDVVLGVYLGNDFTSDMTLYAMRRRYSAHALAWQMSLGPLRTWVRYILSMYGVRTAFAAPQGVYSPVPMTCLTPDGQPVAWHPGYATYLVEENLAEQIPLALEVLDEMTALKERGLNIRVVLIPAAPMLLAGDVNWAQIQPGSRMAQDLPRIAAALDKVRHIALENFTRRGFEVLDLTPLLGASPQRCLYYQPGDTHCTALGYETIGRAIAQRWPELGKPAPPAKP